MQYNPHDYQKYAINYIESHPVSAVFLNMGLGKTSIALTAINNLLFDYFDAHKVLVVGPLRVARDVWPAETEKWDHLQDLICSVAVGTEAERRAALSEPADIYVINRENLCWLIDESGLPLLRENIESSLEEVTSNQIAAIDEQMKSMQQELLATVNSKNTGDELGMEIRRLRDEKQALQNEQASRQDLRTRLDEMMRFLNDLPCELTEYEEDYVRTLLEKITVYDDYFIVEFKSGIEIQIDE